MSFNAESPISECTNTFLRNPDKMQGWILVADKYMQTFVENPETFLLPKAHAFMQPLIEAYAYNLEGFTQYLLGLRDCFDKGSKQFVETQAVYRRVNGRYVQQQRRERMGRAVAKAEQMWGEIPYILRLQWMATLEHEWAQRRLAFLEQQRMRLKQPRLETEQRTEFLLEFWDLIDTEIFNGELPPWNSQNRGATQP